MEIPLIIVDPGPGIHGLAYLPPRIIWYTCLRLTFIPQNHLIVNFRRDQHGHGFGE